MPSQRFKGFTVLKGLEGFKGLERLERLEGFSAVCLLPEDAAAEEVAKESCMAHGDCGNFGWLLHHGL